MLRSDRRQGRGTCSVIVSILLFAGIAAGLFCWFGAGRVPNRVILEVDFDQGMTEYVPDDPLARILLTKKPVLRDVVEALQKASNDKRVKGPVARVGDPKMKLALVQELRDAIISFRASGKPAIAYAETFGEAGPGSATYYLAMAFDAVYMQPSGDVGLTGLIYEQAFLRGTLDKLGINPRLDGRKEYKSYRYVFTERKYIPPHREEVMRVMYSQFGQIVRGIVEARKLSEKQVRSLIDRGPFIGQEAVDAKLIDGLAYRDEVYDRVKGKAGAKAEFLPLEEYLKRAGGPHEKGTGIALIYGAGGIERGKSAYSPAFGGIVMGSDTVATAFRQAVEDKDVKAILFRIDSPGGSYVASDAVRREVVNARKAGKPIVVSMGSTAASGGYFIAVAADKIVAQPATVTGSIGVLGGKMITAGLWNKLGVTWDEVHTSRNADAWTWMKDLTPAQQARFAEWLDRIYEDFISKVSLGRNLPKDEVEKIAKGRIWTGEDAKRLGLIDELGGFPTALRLVRKAAKLADDAPIRLKIYPEKKGWIKLVSVLKQAISGEESESALAQTLEELDPIIRTVGSLGRASHPDALRMQELD